MIDQENIYIECDYCKIGGYDLCPKCFGGGGYSIPLSEYHHPSHTPLKDSSIKISEKLNQIESSNVYYTEKLDSYLNKVLHELSSKSTSLVHENLINQIVRIKAKKETKYWINVFKEKYKSFNLDIFKLLFTDEGLYVDRKNLISDPNKVILAFAAKKEIIGDYSNINKLLSNLISTAIFKIRYGQNDMLNSESETSWLQLTPDKLLGFEISTNIGNAFFIVYLNH